MKTLCIIALSFVSLAVSSGDKKTTHVDVNLSIEKIERDYEVKYAGSIDAQMFYGVEPMWIFIKTDPELAMMRGFIFTVRQKPSDENVCEAIVSAQLEAKTVESYIKQHKDKTDL